MSPTHTPDSGRKAADLAVFRQLIQVIDPAALSDADRRALLGLLKASLPPDPVT